MLTALAKKIVSSAFARMAPALREHTARLVERSYESLAYRRLADWGYRPAFIIDVGAFQGQWSLTARRVFGPLPTLMVEAQAGRLAELEALAATERHLSVAHAILGAREGQAVDFFEMGTGSSVFPETSDAPRMTSRQVTRTLDQVVAERLGSVRDAFLKIDVQGAELEVLKGAGVVLEGCSLIQLELAMLQYNAGAPLLPEVIEWMTQRGWWPTDISGFSRPRDRLVQIDMLFAPKESRLRPTSFHY